MENKIVKWNIQQGIQQYKWKKQEKWKPSEVDITDNIDIYFQS